MTALYGFCWLVFLGGAFLGFLVILHCGLVAMRDGWDAVRNEWRDEEMAEHLARELRLGKCERIDERVLAERRR